MSKPSCPNQDHVWEMFPDDLFKNRRICATCGDWGYVRRRPGGSRPGAPSGKVIPMRCGARNGRSNKGCTKNARHHAYGNMNKAGYCDDHKYLADNARKKEEKTCHP